ncbi:MAG TPA: DNA alkylation repair protein [Actinomycetota bacterium]|nr:DNA alkylation repair protein [Actinomycetota bacterium]
MRRAVREALDELHALADPSRLEGMARYAIPADLGVTIYELRPLAKRLGSDHELALGLWGSGIHEARILAGFVDDPALITEEQMEDWVADFDSWDLCDQVCGLFEQTAFAWKKAREWSRRGEEFVKRAAFAIVAGLAVHDKAAGDGAFVRFLPTIRRGAADDRNFVKKAVSWALRNIGKRNLALNAAALETADDLRGSASRSARWVGSDAARELASERVQKRLRRKARG